MSRIAIPVRTIRKLIKESLVVNSIDDVKQQVRNILVGYLNSHYDPKIDEFNQEIWNTRVNELTNECLKDVFKKFDEIENKLLLTDFSKITKKMPNL